MHRAVHGALRRSPDILWSHLGSIASKLFEFTGSLQTVLLV